MQANGLLPPDDVILDSLGLPLMVVDQDCHILRVNVQAERLTGFYRSKLIGLSCEEVFRMCPCGPHCPARRVLRRGSVPRRGVVTLQTADARSLKVEAIATPLLGPRGRVIGVVELLRELEEHEPTTSAPEATSALPWPDRKVRQEAAAIRQALESSGGNVTQAAQVLQMHRTTLWRKIKRLGL